MLCGFPPLKIVPETGREKGKYPTNSLKKKLFGDRAFYKKVLMVSVPIMVQNAITNFVSLLDNVMIGRVGMNEMSGVSVVNQIMNVFILCLFGGMSGAGIFTAQYYGQNNAEGVRQTMRFKLWLGAVITVVAVFAFHFGGGTLIGTFLTGEGTDADRASTLGFGLDYLRIILFSLPFVAVTQAYSGTLRECGKTLLPMNAGVAAVLTNLILNYILIYGKFGAPALGVRGAALATLISRCVEVLIIVLSSHRNPSVYIFAKGLYKTMKVPLSAVKTIAGKGWLLLANETLWSVGMALLTQCYSVRALEVVGALNIANTIGNIFNIAFIAMGDSVAIIVGQLLGAGKMEEARDTDTKMITFAVMIALCFGTVLFLTAPLFPELYNIEASAKALATSFMRIIAVFSPAVAFLHACYFTLRSGGKTLVTFVYDSLFLCLFSVPAAFVLSRFTALPILAVYAMVQSIDLLKALFGFTLLRNGIWINNLVNTEAIQQQRL